MTTKTKSDPLDCPVCTGTLSRVEVEGYSLFRCGDCGELVQEIGPRPGGGSILSPIGQLLQRNALGDDRVRAATSSPVVSSVKSFLDIYDSTVRILELELGAARGGLRTILAQMENRLDFAIGRLTGLDFASDAVGEALQSLREARDLASILPSRNRGVQEVEDASK